MHCFCTSGQTDARSSRLEQGRNGDQSSSKRQLLHRDPREVEEGLLSRMHRPRGGREAARGGDGASLQRRQPQERRHGADGGHLPSDQAPGPAAALCVLHEQALGAALQPPAVLSHLRAVSGRPGGGEAQEGTPTRPGQEPHADREEGEQR